MGFSQAPGLPYSKLGIPEDGDTASRAISKGKYVIWKGKNYFAKNDILQGETFVEDTNLTEIPEGAINGIADELKKTLMYHSGDSVVYDGFQLIGYKNGYSNMFIGSIWLPKAIGKDISTVTVQCEENSSGNSIYIRCGGGEGSVSFSNVEVRDFKENCIEIGISNSPGGSDQGGAALMRKTTISFS